MNIGKTLSFTLIILSCLISYIIVGSNVSAFKAPFLYFTSGFFLGGFLFVLANFMITLRNGDKYVQVIKLRYNYFGGLLLVGLHLLGILPSL